ncbi:hypothetical protein H1R20_g11190, partial [Candolleomyces eurysporus]
MLNFLHSLTNAGKHILAALPWAQPPPKGLPALPTEILLLIMKELEWDDIINLRMTCKTLHEPSCSKDVWTELLRRYVQYSMPTPFILPRSLSQCSSDVIESIVLKSQAELVIPSSIVASHSFDIPDTSVRTIHLVPGGRWLLAGCTDGSVWYYDLDLLSTDVGSSTQAGRPHLLLESPLSAQQASENQAGIFIAIDHTSELVNASKNPYKVLESFNLAVAVTIMPAGIRSVAHSFQVWRVDVVTNASDKRELTEIKALQRLSFFNDTACIIKDISIHDIHLAYCLAHPSGTTVIVDWCSVNEKSATSDPDLARWYLESSAGSRVFLLPGDLLLLIGYKVSEVTLWKWRQSAARSSLPLSELWDINPGSPFWLYTVPGGADFVHDILPPVTVNGMLQCIVPTARRGVFLISIPDDGDGLVSSSSALPSGFATVFVIIDYQGGQRYRISKPRLQEVAQIRQTNSRIEL